MLLERVSRISEHLRTFAAAHFGVNLGELTVEKPPRLEFGDLAFPFPFQLAKELRLPPRKIAEQIVAEIDVPPEVSRFEAAGGGYVNVFFDRWELFRSLFQWVGTTVNGENSKKIIVEHTNINPNKAAHIGHLRNSTLGDSFVRLLKAAGHRVEIQNYIDNTGVQVADVVVGFRHLRNLTLQEVASIPDPFDYYCWDLYAEVSDWFGKDPSRLDLRMETLHAIESGTGPAAELAEHIADRIVCRHLKTMKRLGVHYDVLPRESEILQLRFWDEAFERLKQREAIEFVTDGPQQGCWVMRLPGEDGRQDENKIIVRSNGTVTYVGKDIAYQLWKFGLMTKSFQYRRFYQYENGSSVWISTTKGEPEAPEFGSGELVYNVIDVRQSYLQRVVVQGLRSLGYREQADRSVHFSYEMVALSPACCEALDIELSDEEKERPYVEVSGRKGLGVKADDLIDALERKSMAEVQKRQPDLEEQAQQLIARQVAIGALRYFMLRFTRNSVIAFDFQEALSFEGETGPYLQYSMVRSGNIFRRLQEQNHDWNLDDWRSSISQSWPFDSKTLELEADHEIWALLLEVARIEEVVQQSISTLEISNLAKHAFSLAQQFNLFYHRHHILNERDALRKDYYLAVADTARRGLHTVLDLLGIEAPERM